MNDDPSQIANHLIEQHGVDGALETVRAGIEASHANGDNYRLSVWREVRRILRDKLDAADHQKGMSRPLLKM
jgi:hypothetical protein